MREWNSCLMSQISIFLLYSDKAIKKLVSYLHNRRLIVCCWLAEVIKKFSLFSDLIFWSDTQVRLKKCTLKRCSANNVFSVKISTHWVLMKFFRIFKVWLKWDGVLRTTFPQNQDRISKIGRWIAQTANIHLNIHSISQICNIPIWHQ